jgi:hypothetical protein
MDVSHGVVGSTINLVEPELRRVEALNTRIRCSILNRGLSFQSRAVQGAHNSIYTFEVLCKIRPIRIFRVEGLDDYTILFCKVCIGRNESKNLERMTWSLGRF